MATYSSNVTNPTPISANESVTINSGAVVTITNGDWSALGTGTITIDFGELKIQNTSTSTGFKFNLYAYNTLPIASSGRGKVTIEGNWIEIGTSNGNASQTATHWDTTGDYIPCVWVETGNGTGVYEKYLNLTGQASTHTVATFSNFSGGDWGKVFTQSGQTITFGDGTNGKIPPNGAKIRVPNIILSHLGSYSSSFPYINSSKMELEVSIAQFSRIWLYARQADNKTFNITSAGLPYYTEYSGISYANLTDCAFCPNGAEATYIFTASNFSGNTKLLKMNNCSGWSANTTNPINLSVCNYEFTDCEFFQIDASNTDAVHVIIADAKCSGKIRGGKFTGLNLAHSNLDIAKSAKGDVLLAENPLLSETNTSLSKHALAMGYTSATCSNISVKDITIPSGGGFYAYVFYFNGPVEDLTIASVSVSSSRFYGLANSATHYHSRWRWSDIYLQGFRTLFINTMYVFDYIFQNIRSDSYGAWMSSITSSSAYGSLRGVASNTTIPTTGTKTDQFFYELYNASTTGILGVLFTSPTDLSSSYVTLTGTAAFNVNQALYLPNVDDSCTIEADHTILGISGFRNLAPVIGGSGTGNISCEYAIDTGSGYSSWKTLNATNLFGESVSESSGFKIKLRFTCVNASSTNYLNQCSIYTNVDQTVKYPQSLVSITLENIVSGSRYYIVKNSDSSVIASGEASSGTVEIPNIPYSGNVAVTIRVRKPGYVPFETGGTITASGLSTFVSQITDNIYQ